MNGSSGRACRYHRKHVCSVVYWFEVVARERMVADCSVVCLQGDKTGAAMLFQMYMKGIGYRHNFRKAIFWREKTVGEAPDCVLSRF